MQELRPLRNLVYVERVKREVSAGGILLPQTFDNQNRPSLRHGAVADYFEAKVLAVGPLVQELTVGDTILVHTYAGGDGSKLYTGEGTTDAERLFVKYPEDLLAAVPA